MNFAPTPTLLFTLVSLFRKRATQPTFTPAAPPVATQVFVTRDTTTHVDPPLSFASPAGEKRWAHYAPTSENEYSPIDEKYTYAYPETPRAPHPHRTTFAFPVTPHDWRNAAFFTDDVRLQSPSPSPSYDSEERALVWHSGAEPRTLAKALFFFGFLFPLFWVAGTVIILMPLRTTKDWEAGRSQAEIELGRALIRETELRWAKRCLVALISELIIALIVIVIVKWGVVASV